MSSPLPDSSLPSSSDAETLHRVLRDCLGWLNFSSDLGEEDVHFFRVLDQVFRAVAKTLPPPSPAATPLDEPLADEPLTSHKQRRRRDRNRDGKDGEDKRKAKGKTAISQEIVFNGRIRLDRFSTQPSLWRECFRLLREELSIAKKDAPAFTQITQASQVIDLTEYVVFPAYREFHRDLLFHQTDESLFQPFFVARTMEIVLRILQSDEVDPSDSKGIADRAVAAMNDYLGYRPIPVLHNQQKMEPWPHEFSGVVPLWIAGAGIASGR